MVSSVGCVANLARVVRRRQLWRYVNNSPPGQRWVRNSVLADTVEAIIGAVYIDGGELAAKRLKDTWGLLRMDLSAVSQRLDRF